VSKRDRPRSTDLSAKLERCGSGCRAEPFPERRGLSTRSRTNVWRNRIGSSACKTPTPSHRAAHHDSYRDSRRLHRRRVRQSVGCRTSSRRTLISARRGDCCFCADLELSGRTIPASPARCTPRPACSVNPFSVKILNQCTGRYRRNRVRVRTGFLHRGTIRSTT